MENWVNLPTYYLYIDIKNYTEKGLFEVEVISSYGSARHFVLDGQLGSAMKKELLRVTMHSKSKSKLFRH